MSSYLENLETRRDKVAAALASLTVYEGADKPNFNGENSVDHVGKIRELRAELKDINELIAAHLETVPYIRESRGVC